MDDPSAASDGSRRRLKRNGRATRAGVAVSRFSGSTFTIVAGGAATSYATGGFLGTGTSFSHAILRDRTTPNSFLIGGDGFVGRATVLGPGSVAYSLITNNVGLVAQMTWNDAGLVVIADGGTSQVRLLDPQSGAVVDLSSGPQPWGNDLSAGAWDPATGDVVLGGSGALYRLATGASTATPIVSGLGGFVSAVAFDPITGEAVATVLTVNRLVRVATGGSVGNIAPPGSLPGPNALDVDHNGDFVTGGGVGQIHRVPRTGGSPVQIGNAGGPVTGVSVAGAGGYGVPFGQACNGVAGPTTLTASGTFQVLSTVTTTSINHAPSSLGVVILGLSRTTHPGLPLPLLLDPVLGTAGCFANVSLDVAILQLTDATTPANLTYTLALPPSFGGHDFYAQHACFEGVPGGMSWSNGLTFRVP
jgi:hypothetical protein